MWLVPFLVFFLGSFLCVSSPVFALDTGAEGMGESEEIHLVQGDLETLPAKSLVRVSVSDPNIADVVDAQGEKVLILAKKPGQTSLFLWDEAGKHTYIIRVFEEDLSLLETRIKGLIEKANISGVMLNSNSYEGKVVITGELPAGKKEDLESLLEPFQSSVLNLVKELVVEDLIQIDVQIVELNASASKNIGFDWQNAITVEETLPTFDGTFDDLFRIGDLGRTQMTSIINMLVTEGKGKVLSKPKLVVLSGKEASFLVGGEVPVTTTTSLTTGAQQENVEYRDFGVSLNITPTLRNEKIDVLLEVEVSEIDSTNSIGDNFAFTTRTAQTQLYLEDGQTIVLAGLIKQNENETVSKVPFLGDIPILGALFRNRERPSNANTDTELVISLTPKVIKQNKTAKAPKQEKETVVSTTSYEGSSSAMMEKRPDMMEVAKPQMPEKMSPYINAIQNKIASTIVYPDEAQMNGWEGTVKLALHVLNDGTLAHASVKESSGYSLFDQGALMAAKTSAPYSGFPSEVGLQEISVTVPIVYSLGKK